VFRFVDDADGKQIADMPLLTHGLQSEHNQYRGIIHMNDAKPVVAL
jgi:hypothetical protein